MKDTFYFHVSGTECEHSFLEEFFKEGLEKRGYELLYYRKFKKGHVAMEREAKTNAPRWVVLELCAEWNINIVASGFYYKNGVMDHEVYDMGYEYR